MNINSTLKVGVLGFGGLGQAAARILIHKQEMTWVAAADLQGYSYREKGLDTDRAITIYNEKGSVGYY